MPHDEFADEDPMGLVGMVMPGEPGQLEAMAECFVEEYARMGWDERRLMTLFVSPMFLATHRIYKLKGEDYVRHLIHKMCAKWGVDNARTAAPSSQTTVSLVEDVGLYDKIETCGLGQFPFGGES